MSPSAAAAAATAAVGVPVQISSSWGASHQQQQRNVDVGGGLISLTAHALQLCAHAARCNVQDLQTTPWAWRTLPTYTGKHHEENMKDGATSINPASASSPWTYVQHALLYHRQHVPTTRKEAEDDLDNWLGHWDETTTTTAAETKPPLPLHLLGRISLYYVSSRELTQDELKNPHVVPQEDDEEEDDEDIDEDDDEVMDGSSKQKSINLQSSATQSASSATAPPPEVLSSSFWRRFGSNSSVVVLLYHAVVEYRSLPATGNPWAVQAEAWSMMTWGQGSPLDEELKWAALAGLSDPQSKYRLEIESVRGKRYQFDWIPATSPPPLINIDEDDDDDDDEDVFDHNSSQWAQCLGVRVSDKPETLASPLPSHHSSSKWALTRMQYRLDAKSASRDALYSAASFFQQQQQKDHSSATVGLYRVPKLLQDHFLQLNPQPPTLIRAYPSGHALILTPVKTGRSLGQVYWQGRFWKHWNKSSDNDITNDDEVDDVWNHVPALFGMNLNAPFPLIGGGGGPTATMTTPLVQPPPPRPGSGSGSSDSPKRRASVTIVDVPMSSASPSTLLKQAYAVMWQELLIDARYERWDLAGKLLNRLIYDVDQADEEDDGILAEDFEEDETDQKNGRQVNSGSTSPLIVWPQHPPPSANVDCLESIVLQSHVFDPVGIAAKALATHFAQTYGAKAFPCLSHEVEWVKHELPKRRPIVVVPMRALNVLRRGGYFDVARTKQDMLLEQQQQQQQVVGLNPPSPPNLKEKVLHLACGLLDQAEGSTGYRILHQERSWRESVILVPAEEDLPLCTFDAFSNVFRIRDDFLTLDWSSRLGTPFCVNEQDESSVSTAAMLLGMYMAQVHPSGSDVLVRYMFQNARLPTK